MCLHNAQRDDFILRPTRLHKADGDWFWNPVSGVLSKGEPAVAPSEMTPLRRRKRSDLSGGSDLAG